MLATKVTKYKRTIFHIVWDVTRKKWLCLVGGAVLKSFDSKVFIVKAARYTCRAIQQGGFTAQLVVHDKKGRFEFENTYGADPVRTKG